MHFEQTEIGGVWIIAPELLTDPRGFFARTWCRDELLKHDLVAEIAQCSISYNRAKGTLRGMHFQRPPHEEAKIVTCVAGAVHDVALDLRAGSSTFRKWTSVVLSAENRRSIYIPPGCAHGFQTLADHAVVQYYISTPYVPGASEGVRWNDGAFGIRWPLAEPILSDRDRAFADFAP